MLDVKPLMQQLVRKRTSLRVQHLSVVCLLRRKAVVFSLRSLHQSCSLQPSLSNFSFLPT